MPQVYGLPLVLVAGKGRAMPLKEQGKGRTVAMEMVRAAVVTAEMVTVLVMAYLT